MPFSGRNNCFMFCDKNFASKSVLISTASISKNMGFSTTKSSSLHVLNDLLIKFIDCLAKKMKRFVELKAVTAEVTFVDVIEVLEQMDFSLSELSDYLNSVADFTFCSTVPKFPVQFHQTQQFDRNSTMNLTAELAPCERFIEIRQKFPDYVGKSSRELEMNQCVANVDLNDTLDSMASPFLELRRISTRKMSKDLFVSSIPKFNHQLSKCDVAEKGFRSVLSNKGLTLRLLNCNADTPPGFFSSRSQK